MVDRVAPDRPSRDPGLRCAADRAVGRAHSPSREACSVPDHIPPDTSSASLRLGVAGPVGTGKSSLIALICRELATELSLAVITNDIYTDEDARFLRSAGVLAPERIRAVETGACPHTAIRDDVTAEPAGGRGPGARLRPARCRAGGVRRRQPDRDLLPGAGRRAVLRPRRRRRWRRRPQGRTGHRPRRPVGRQQDRPGAVRRGRRRPDGRRRRSGPRRSPGDRVVPQRSGLGSPAAGGCWTPWPTSARAWSGRRSRSDGAARPRRWGGMHTRTPVTGRVPDHVH